MQKKSSKNPSLSGNDWTDFFMFMFAVWISSLWAVAILGFAGHLGSVISGVSIAEIIQFPSTKDEDEK